MNADMAQGTWSQIRGEVKRRWGKLSDNDLDVVTGQTDRLVGLLQEKYGYTRQKAEKQVNRFMEQYGDNVQDMASTMSGKVRDFVRDYPWSVGVLVLVVGLVVGLLVMRPNNMGSGMEKS